jgi:hypothetical protein
MAAEMVGVDAVTVEWGFGILVTVGITLVGWMQVRHNAEVEARVKNDEALWKQVNEINRDIRELVTKVDLNQMELRLSQRISEVSQRMTDTAPHRKGGD